MKFLFLGSVIKTEDCTKHLGPSIAGNKMQIGLIKVLKGHFGIEMSVFSEYPIASFPHEKTFYIKKGLIELTEFVNAEKVPFINIFLFKQITKIINAFLMIRKWTKSFINEDKVILCFNAFPDIAIPTLLAKRLFGVKIVCVLADLPIDVVNRNVIGKIFRSIEEKVTLNSIKHFDALVVLNKKAIEIYAPSSKYIVVDGGFELEDAPNSSCGGQWLTVTENEPLRVIFSGALVEYNGIVNLIQSANLVKNQRFRLEIYGSGPLENYVKECCNHRIQYMGNVTNSEMVKIQQEAALLVNPRKVRDPVSMVTFPSKMIEYLLSGTPVVTTKLNGYTEGYLNHMFIFNEETPSAMADTIDNILLQNPLKLIQKTKDARKFISEKKNWGVQSEKIIRLIDAIGSK